MAPIDAMWMSGRWLPAGYLNPGIADSMTDIYGQPITVGSVVKLVGIVTALNPSDPHFQDITIKPMFPQTGVIQPEAGVYPQNIPVKTYQFHPLQLVVGS